MPTMVVKQEVEATPQLVVSLLQNFIGQIENDQFPHPRGTLILLKETYNQALGGIPDMPAIVVAASKGTQFGLIAIQRQAGDTTMTLITKDQVEKVWNS